MEADEHKRSSLAVAIAKLQEVLALGVHVLGLQAHATLAVGLRQLEEERAGRSTADGLSAGVRTALCTEDMKSMSVGVDEEDESVVANREYTRKVLDRITTLEEAKLTLQRTQAVAMMAQRMSMAKSEDECLHLVSKLLVALFDVPRSSVALLTPDKQHCEGVQMAIVKENMANVCLVKFSEWSSCYSLMPPRRAAPFINN
jgi:hypothetical protein